MKLNELQVGMLIKEGLITKIGYPNTNDSIHGNDAYLVIMDSDDPFYGQCSFSIKEDDDFMILHEKGSNQYKETLKFFIVERQKYINDAMLDINLINSFLQL